MHSQRLRRDESSFTLVTALLKHSKKLKHADVDRRRMSSFGRVILDGVKWRFLKIIGYNRAIAIVVAIWVLGYALALPVGIFSRAVSYDKLCGVFCEEIWSVLSKPATLTAICSSLKGSNTFCRPDTNDSGRSAGRRLYGLSVLLSQFGVPALISSICYWLISRVMSSQLERRRGHTLLKESEEKLVNRKSRANRYTSCGEGSREERLDDQRFQDDARHGARIRFRVDAIECHQSVSRLEHVRQ